MGQDGEAPADTGRPALTAAPPEHGLPIASVYGMNFNPEVSPFNMLELNWYFGYPWSLLVMLAVGGGLFTYFRRRDWL